jgi:hypothetical protein
LLIKIQALFCKLGDLFSGVGDRCSGSFRSCRSDYPSKQQFNSLPGMITAIKNALLPSGAWLGKPDEFN